MLTVHEGMRQLSYGLVKHRSYGQYDVNEFQFRSTQFEALRPLMLTTNTGVVMRAIGNQGWKTNYYGIINSILEFNFARNKDLKVIFFIVIGLITIMKLRQNQFNIMEVKHNESLRGYDTFIFILSRASVLSSLSIRKDRCLVCSTQGESPWTVIYSNCSWLSWYSALNGEIGEVYQEEELPVSFNVESILALDHLVGDANNIQSPEKRT
jgi:hypothetical protein